MSLIILYLTITAAAIIFLATLAVITIVIYFLITFIEWTFDKIDRINQ